MPSPIRVPIYERTHSDIASSDEDGNDAIAAYLTPLLTKHDRGQPLVYEDLLESYEVAKAVAASSASTKAMQGLGNMHNSQLLAYEACARTELTKLAESRAYPTLEEGESMPRYIERAITTIKDGDQNSKGWRVSSDFMEEAFWSKVKAGARKAYFALKSKSIEKDKEGKTADQTTGKVKAFEAAALGALVSKSESQDSEMTAEEDGVEENDITDDDQGDDDDGEEEGEEEEEDGEDDDAEEEGEDNDAGEDDDVEEEAEDHDGGDGVNGDVVPAKTPMKTKKRRRLPNGPLGGGGAGTTTDGGKKQQPTKKQKTGPGTNRGTNGGAGRGTNGGRGKGGAKSGKAGRGGGGGRGTRKRNRKKGTGVGAGAGGVA